MRKLILVFVVVLFTGCEQVGRYTFHVQADAVYRFDSVTGEVCVTAIGLDEATKTPIFHPANSLGQFACNDKVSAR